MNLIFDLDGTLICSKNRLYQLFNDLAPMSRLSFKDYWALKFSRMSNLEILKEYFSYDENQLKTFQRDWMSLIENEHYLKMDKVLDGGLECLTSLSEYSDLYVCTARQHKALVFSQLERMGFGGQFKDILVTEQKTSKEDLIKKYVPNLSESDWIIGDTGNDILTGKAICIKTCGVLSGFMNYENLISYSPDIITENFISFKY